MYCYSNWHYLDTYLDTYAQLCSYQKKFWFTALVLSEEWVWLQKKREAERSCESVFRINFCKNFYPEVLRTSWMPTLNINILWTEPLFCKTQIPHSQSKTLPLVHLRVVSSLQLQWAQHETFGKRIIWIFICSGNFVTAFIHHCRDEQPAKPVHLHNTLSCLSEIWRCTLDWL